MVLLLSQLNWEFNIMSLRNLSCGLFSLVSLSNAPAFAHNTGIIISNDHNIVIIVAIAKAPLNSSAQMN
jgi:hypothetical protein